MSLLGLFSKTAPGLILVNKPWAYLLSLAYLLVNKPRAYLRFGLIYANICTPLGAVYTSVYYPFITRCNNGKTVFFVNG